MTQLNLFILLLGAALTVPAFLVTVQSLFQSLSERTGRVLQDSLARPFLLGLVNLVFFFFLAALLFKLAQDRLSGLLAGLTALLALLIFISLAIFSALGLSGLNRWMANKLDPMKSGLSGDLRSALLLTLACLTPYLGWFLLTPFVFATGLGAAIMAVFRRRTAPTPAET